MVHVHRKCLAKFCLINYINEQNNQDNNEKFKVTIAQSDDVL